MASALSFSSAFAEAQVTIPLGASISANPFSLSPSVVNAKVNDTVTWQNQDSTIHSVTTGTTQYGFDGRIDSGPIHPGSSFSHTFDKSGVYQYFCLFHPWMTGVVNVGVGGSVDPVIQIVFSTDKTSYKSGDNMMISGHVSKFIPNEQITVWVEDPQGKAIAANHVETDDGSKFETIIPVAGNLWVPGSTYTVFAQYGYKSDVAESRIAFESNAQAQPSQTSTTQTEASGNLFVTTSYPTAHKVIPADQNEYLTVQTEKRIYFPGEQVKIFGSIWNGMFQEVGGPAYLITAPAVGIGSNSVAEVVSIQVRDTEGNVVLNQKTVADNNGEYSATLKIPQNAMSEQYTANAIIQTKAGLINSLDASVSAKLDSSVSFAVSTQSQFAVNTKSGNLDVYIGSNSTINNFEFSSEQKKISFSVQGLTGTKGVTLITIPKAVLGGQLQVFMDGSLLAYNSDNVIVTSDARDSTTLEIDYHHSAHTLEIAGTQAAEPGTETVPEFGPVAQIMLAISILSIFILSFRTRFLK